MQDELSAIKARNARVERDKAWETSWVRRGFIMLVTYLIAALYMEVADCVVQTSARPMRHVVREVIRLYRLHYN